MTDADKVHLDIEVDDSEAPPRLTLRGELDLSGADRLQAAIADVTSRVPGSGLVIEVSGLAFMDSTGLGVLLGATRRTAPGRVTLVNPTTSVLRLLEVSGCLDLFDQLQES